MDRPDQSSSSAASKYNGTFSILARTRRDATVSTKITIKKKLYIKKKKIYKGRNIHAVQGVLRDGSGDVCLLFKQHCCAIEFEKMTTSQSYTSEHI
jgi:hypothetical protein